MIMWILYIVVKGRSRRKKRRKNGQKNRYILVYLSQKRKKPPKRRGAATLGRKPKERPKRTSGRGYDITTVSGKAAVQHLTYSRQAPDGTYEIDTERIRAICEEYVSPANREQKIITKNKKEGTETVQIVYKPISRQGLRRKLDISRQTYGYWLEGYVSAADKEDEDCLPNTELMAAMRVGDDAIMQYLAEDDDKYSQTKQIRLLESYGEIMPVKQVKEISAKLELGKLSRYAK